MEEPSSTANPLLQKRKKNRIFDLDMKRSIGAISSIEYKRRTIINEMNHLAYGIKTSLPAIYINQINTEFPNYIQDDIIDMEIDPKESRCLLVISRYNNVSIYNVSKGVNIFDQLIQITIPNLQMDYRGQSNSVHWLWDGTIFTVGTMDNIYFWDSSTCKIIETIKTRTKALNHVIAAKKYSANKYVAVAGIKGNVYLIDLTHGIVVMTMRNVEDFPIRTIHWHPNNELQYVTGNNNGNIHLWDIRNQNDFVSKFKRDDESFSPATSHFSSISGVRFYNDGNSVISVDTAGYIKTWEVSTGNMRPTYYQPAHLCKSYRQNLYKSYHFDSTENLKQDIVFMPTLNGMRIFDIDSGEHLPHSNDISLPVTCASFDKQRYCVYGGSDDVVKVWTPEHKEI